MFVFSGATAASFDPYRPGDANSDDSVNVKDVLAIRKYLVSQGDTINTLAADVDGDGDVTMADVLMLRKHLARLITINTDVVTDRYLRDITVYGVSLSEYTIVIPEYADVFTVYAAELLQDYVKDKSGIVMNISFDTAAATPYEFLMGNTNRPESARASGVTLADDEYLLKADGYKVVMLGNSYMIGGGVGKFTYDYITYDSGSTGGVCDIYNLPVTDTAEKYEPREAKSAILMIGDGMGSVHIPATLNYNAARNIEPDYKEFSAQRLPASCSLTTYSLTTSSSGGSTPTDSAAAGTALACGIKTDNYKVGLDRYGNAVTNIRELAESLGKKTGVVSTEFTQGATPAAFTVHAPSRLEYDYIKSLQAYVTDIEYLKGDVEDNLLEETKYTLDLLSTNNEDGFFAMIEEANIDTWSHNNKPDLTVHCMARYNKAIQYAMVFAVSHPDTLLIITADHETGGITANCTFTTTGHTTANVPLYAIGMGSERFVGTVDNTFVPKVIASGWGVSNFGG